MVPRRPVREVPRWRRGRQPYRPGPQVVYVRAPAGDARALPVPPAGPVPGNRVLAASGAWRSRRQFPPLAWGTAVVVLGAVPALTPHPVLAAVLAAVTAAVVIVGFTRHASMFARRWSDIAALLTLAWVPVLAVCGFGPPVPAVFTVTWLACSVPWWLHYKSHPVAVGAEAVTDDYERWNTLAAARGWKASLGPVQALPGGGRRYPVQADGIKTVMRDILAVPDNVAGAWHKPVTETYTERDPHGVTSRGFLTILGGDTLQAPREWNGTGMDPATGLAVIGRYADGSPVHVKLYTPRYGSRHGLVSGTTGSGKTETLNLLIFIALASSGVFVPVVLDPQEGQSLPFWRDRVLYASGTEACHAMLRGLHAGMLDRSRYLASLRWDDDGVRMTGMPFFDHVLTGLPMPLIVFDEAHMALKGNTRAERQIVDMVTEIGRLGRKTGTELVLATHIPSLAELGGEHALRDMLRGGNVISMRTANRVGGSMLGLVKDPSELPRFFPDGRETFGLGYADGPDARPDAPMRTDLVPKGMLRSVPRVPVLDDGFLEAMDRTAPGVPVTAPSAVVEADDGPEGRACADAVLQVLTALGKPAERGDVIKAASELAVTGWGRDRPWTLRSFTNAFGRLTDDAKIIRVRDGVYQAAAVNSPREGQS